MADPFLAAILADPKDDLCRLIYADYLDERGDPRGEFIRAQIELSRTKAWCPADPERMKAECPCTWHTLKRRERDILLYPHFDHWSLVPWACDRNWTMTWHAKETRFRVGASELTQNIWCEPTRGFISAITCTADDWVRYADAITAATPLERVTLRTEPSTDETTRAVTFGNSHGTEYIRNLHGRKPRCSRVVTDDELRRSSFNFSNWSSIVEMHNQEAIRELLAFEWPRIKFTIAPPATDNHLRRAAPPARTALGSSIIAL